jgi:Ras-related protein Rab-11A
MIADLTFKVIIGGQGGVGKTTLLHKYVENIFIEDTKMTIGVEILNKEVVAYDGRVCALQLWDFGGQDRFRFFQDGFVLGAAGAFIMFDLTKLMTFNRLKEWVEMVRKHDPSLPIVLLGSKYDLNYPSVEDKYVLDFMTENDITKYLKVSSKTGLNVEEAFQFLIQDIIEYKASSQNPQIVSQSV